MDIAANRAIMDDAIAYRWIAANAMVLVICAVCGFAGTGADALFAIDSSDLTTPARMAYWTIQVALVVIPCAAYAVLTAPVLQSIIPALRSDTWLVAHVMMGVVLGGSAALLVGMTDKGDSSTWVGESTDTIVFMTIFFAVLGLILGAVVGIVQSLVWRRVARGSRFWIAMSALSASVVFLIVFAASPLFAEGTKLVTEGILQGFLLIGGVVSTLILLPAVRRLQPRG